MSSFFRDHPVSSSRKTRWAFRVSSAIFIAPWLDHLGLIDQAAWNFKDDELTKPDLEGS